MRRQSSAFEFSRTAPVKEKHPMSLRRQSSAFEIAARNRQLHPVQAEFNADRNAEQRSSLRRKNSSVKDLVRKLENSSLKSEEPKVDLVVEAQAFDVEPEVVDLPVVNNDGEANNDDEFGWTDATEFFKNPNQVLPHHRRLMQEEIAGTKRSSIIRIRQENKGRVLKSVQNFSRPEMPPPSIRTTLRTASTSSTPLRNGSRAGPSTTSSLVTPVRGVRSSSSTASSTATPVRTPSRRLSARMGVVAATSSPTGKNSTPPQTRRQTLTGIRTSAHAAANNKSTLGHNNPKLPHHSHHHHNNANKRVTVKKTPEVVVLDNSAPSSSSRRKRNNYRQNNLDNRRHKTIGYPGEVRSPLRERGNISATVQRSHSAQTPLQNKPKAPKSKVKLQQHHSMVRRSHSLRSPMVKIDENGRVSSVVRAQEDNSPMLRTPKNNKVKRHGSERSAVKVTVNSIPIRSPRVF